MSKNIEQKIIILSDLWGKEKSDWDTYYISFLEEYFEVKYYDSCVLGEIDKSKYSEEKFHTQFITEGIDKAVENLLKKEKESSIVLGFSIGGTIAWKACLSGLKTQKLIAISSTRLRYEIQKPSGVIQLIYGEEDLYKPDNSWFEKLALRRNFYKQEGHALYKKNEWAEKICDLIISKKQLNLPPQ